MTVRRLSDFPTETNAPVQQQRQAALEYRRPPALPSTATTMTTTPKTVIGGGLINAGTPRPVGEVDTQSAPGYTAAQFQSTPSVVSSNETVQSQISDIIAANSPLMQQAKAQGAIQANARGLLSSTMAGQAQQQAVLNTALPIAQQDASTYAQARGATDLAANQASQRNAELQNAALQQSAANIQERDIVNIGEAGALQRLNISEAGQMQRLIIGEAGTTLRQEQELATNRWLGTLDSETRLSLANIDTNTKLLLGQLDADNRQLLQANASAAATFQEVTGNLATIASSDMGKKGKAAATTTQLNLLHESMALFNAIATTPQLTLSQLDISRFFAAAAADSAVNEVQVQKDQKIKKDKARGIGAFAPSPDLDFPSAEDY